MIDKEIEIVHELGQQVLTNEEMLNVVSEVCGELDRYVGGPLVREVANEASLLALAQGARRYKFCRPVVTEKNVIQIKGGR